MIRWLLVVAGREVAACFAPCRSEAEVALGPIPHGGYVTSEASWRIGLPRAVREALERPALCVVCGRRAVSAHYVTRGWCRVCGAASQAAMRSERSERHGKRGPDRVARKVASKSAAHRRRIGDAVRHAWAAKKAGTPLPEGVVREMRARLDAVSGDVGKVRVGKGGRPTLVAQRAAHRAKCAANALARGNE